MADMSFLEALLWYGARFIVSLLVAFGAIKLGIRLRKNKNAKSEN